MDLVSRVKGILLNPKNEWAAIDAETTSTGALYTGYIVPLAAIPAICNFIGLTIVGYNFLGVSGKLPMSTGLTNAVVSFAMSLVSVYVMALIINALAPNFGGTKSPTQALKVAAYSSTAVWVCGIFTILPTLSVLGILGLYSLYLLFVGLPILMKSPPEKAMGYTIVIIICWIVLFVVVGAVVAAVAGTGAMLRP